ncbi:MAG: Fic family protein [Alphaproteobacteria bacterium]
MKDPTDPPRESRPHRDEIPSDPDTLARREARNGLRQFDAAYAFIADKVRASEPFRLRPSHALMLNRFAIDGINPYAGVYRPHAIKITNSEHNPPPPEEVPGLIEKMCHYINQNWNKSAVHLGAYILWRMNWIHSFDDGNGRTSRMLSYVVLCIRLGYNLPIINTIPDQVSKNKSPYFRGLEAADRAWKTEHIDVGALEELLSNLLAAQLAKVVDDAERSRD